MWDSSAGQDGRQHRRRASPVDSGQAAPSRDRDAKGKTINLDSDCYGGAPLLHDDDDDAADLEKGARNASWDGDGGRASDDSSPSRRASPGPSASGPAAGLDGRADEAGNSGATTPTSRKKDSAKRQETVRWRDLPEKGQLTVLTLARLSEPLVQTSLQSYMFYQLKSFQPDLSSSVIAAQSGVLHASFTAAQCLTAMAWGRLADSPRFGRKNVLMIGLAGTMVSCIGFGFSQAFWPALMFRSIGGATNGNVGVLRTMISEIIREKKYQSRAFLILPMTFNVGVIVGPILGGLLSDPAHSYPKQFGGSRFLLRFPYATPNLVSAFFLFLALLAVWLGLEETLDSKRGDRDLGIALRRSVASLFRRSPDAFAYAPLPTHSRDASDASSAVVEMTPVAPGTSGTPARDARRPRYTQRLAFRRMLTRNVTLTLVAQSVFAFHMGTFNSLWFVFLSTPVFDPHAPPAPGSAAAKAAHYVARKLPFAFTGGIGMPPRDVGMAMAILGCFGILMQILLYPAAAARLGTVRSWRLSLCCFPVVYFAVPFLSLVPSVSGPPHAKDGAGIWLAIAALLLVQVTGRTFALPAQTILVNNCTPHPSVLGTMHGLAQSTNSLARTVGPMLCGYLYGLGLKHGIVGAVFWGLSVVAVLGCVASLLVYEGNGHEIWLEGDADEPE